MSYGADYDDLYRKAAHYVDRILKGTKPADLPVQQATKFEFIISLPAAKQIGYTVPYELLARANRVSESEEGSSLTSGSVSAGNRSMGIRRRSHDFHLTIAHCLLPIA